MAITSLVVALGSVAYSAGLLRARVDDHHEEIKRLRDRVDRLYEHHSSD